MSTRLMIAAFALAALALPATADAKKADSIFYGTVVHSSTHSIKVKNTRTGETLEFQIIPRATKIQGRVKAHNMLAIRPGDFVKVYYDQHFLGLRHADVIIDSEHPGMKMKG